MADEPQLLPELPIAHDELVDPLRDVTRRERRMLLVINVVLLAIVFGDLVPTRVEALGISVSQAESNWLVILLLSVDLYLVMAFWIYATADIRAWEMKLAAQDENVRRNISRLYLRLKGEDGLAYAERKDLADKVYDAPWRISRKIYGRRRWFEYWFPIVLTALTAISVAVDLARAA